MLIPEALRIHCLKSLLKFKGQKAYDHRLSKKISVIRLLVYVDMIKS